MLALLSTLTSTETATSTRTFAVTSTPAIERAAFEMSALRFEFSAQLFVRARARKEQDADFAKSYALTRARLNLTVRYQDLLRVTIEPDFASAFCSVTGTVCSDAELSDAFFEVSPLEELDVRIGHAKAPFGSLETTSAWRLPAQRRGMLNDVLVERLGFGGRKLGAKARVKLKQIAFKPSLELGTYTSPDRDAAEDFAARAIVKPWKNGEVQLQAYGANDALTNGGLAASGALAVLHETKKIFAVAEVFYGRGRLLSLSGDTGVDSSFFALRALAAYAIRIDEGRRFELEPYFGGDVFDPSLDARDDLGFELRGGANFYFLRMFRVNVEAARRQGQSAFPEPDATVLSLLLGASLG